MTTASATPASPAAQRLELVPLARLVESPSNHRKKTWGDMKELTESVKAKGVLQPILARPAKGIGNNLLEIVFGHRRFRAAKEAGLDAIPAVVRELTDVEALEANIIENASRADVHPLEEAEGIEQLLEQKDRPYTVEEIARKLGKSHSHVYQRLKLLALCPEARKAFYEGGLTASTALMFARIPSKDLQKKALAEFRISDRNDDPPTASWISQRLQERFMLKLADAPFQADDAELVKAAGSCSACSKRTGAQPALFEDVSSADVCTDPACYREKVDAAWKVRSAAAKAAGRKVLTSTEAKEVFESYNGTSLSYRAPYVDLASSNYLDPKNRPYKKLLGKSAEAEIVLAKDGAGNVRELLPKAALGKLMKAAGHSFKSDHEPARQSKEAKEANRKAKAKAELERKVQERCATLFGAAIDKRSFTRELWDLVLGRASTMCGLGEEVVLKRRFGDGWEKDFDKARPKMTVEQLQAVLVELTLTDAFFEYRGLEGAEAKKLAAWAGIDMKAVRAELQAEAKSAPPAKGKKTAGKAAAARDLPRATKEDLADEACLDCGVAAGKPSPGCDACDHPEAPAPGRPAGELAWQEVDGTHRAEAPGGEYQVLPGSGAQLTWRASWVPKQGPSKSVASSVKLADAKAACARHHLEQLADATLANAGAGALNTKGLKGAAVASKKGGRR